MDEGTTRQLQWVAADEDDADYCDNNNLTKPSNSGVTYDVKDTTAAKRRDRNAKSVRRMMILPNPGSSPSHRQGEDDPSGGCAPMQAGRCSGAGNDLTSSTQAARYPGVLLSLPHTRHGAPSMFLCSTGSAGSNMSTALYEVQAQSLSAHAYGQMWFVPGDEVIPDGGSGTLVCTPFDLTFAALYELNDISVSNNRNTNGFVSAENLYHRPSCAGVDGARHNDDNADDYDNDDPFASFGTTARQTSSSTTTHKAVAAEVPQWPGWEAAAARYPTVLSNVWSHLQSHALLQHICEFKESAGAFYYQFSPEKAAQWAAAKVHKVRASDALRTVLQLPATEEVPLDVALSIVGEYLPDSISARVATACGVAPHSSAVSSGGVGASPSSDALPQPSAPGGAMDAKKQPAASLKSASVKRLEKAGRPKGTPTLFAMFAKKSTTEQKKTE